MNETTPGFTIKVVAARTGIPVHTLRAWERRYGVPKPKRDAGNRYRLYDEQDIADILWLKRQVDSGISPAQASAILRHERRPPGAASLAEPTRPLAAARALLQDALARSDQAAARQVLDEAFALFTPEQVALAMIEPAMNQIGDRWMHNELTVWQEHLASHLIQQRLAAVLQSQPALPATAPSLVAACAPNEEHALGLLTFSLLARRQGWRVAFLGQATPLADLRDSALSNKPEAVAVSITTVIGLAGLIPWLGEAQRPPFALVFGGRLPRLLPALREHLPGEYLGDDALTAARALVSAQARPDYWSPSARTWKAVEALSAGRLRIASDVLAQWMASLPPHLLQTWSYADLEQATLFLVDALLSALAFDVPDLVDLQRQWLAEAMPLRHVPEELLLRHFEILGEVFQRDLKEQHRDYQPLLDRIKQPPVK